MNVPENIMRLDRWYDDLCRRIHDPSYDLIKNNYRIVEEVRDFILEDCRISGRSYDDRWLRNPLVEDLLLRVRNTSAAVYAITVGQFPEYDYLEEYWHRNGYRDITGYLWLAPRA